jgi:molecular chaperone GrpE
MTQNEANMDQINAKKEAKSSILDTVLGIKAAKEANEPKENPEVKIKELTESLQRLQAEFENFQKRNSKQNDEFKVFANAKMIEDLLPVLDSLEQGMQHSKDLVILYEQINGILKKKGLEKILIKKGMPFNHDEMECLLQESDSKLPVDCVVNVLMNGYKLNGKILRLARVSVNNFDKKCVNNVNDKSSEKIVEEKENQIDGENMTEKNKDKEKEKKSNLKEKCEEKNEHEGITKCDFEIKIMESD